MIYCSTGNLERVFFYPNDDSTETHWIDMEMSSCGSTFKVTYCCDEEWVWKFFYDKTNYEIVKYLIMDCIAVCDTMEELIDALDEIFEEDCADFVCYEAELQEDEIEFECGCDGDCDDCKMIF